MTQTAMSSMPQQTFFGSNASVMTTAQQMPRVVLRRVMLRVVLVLSLGFVYAGCDSGGTDTSSEPEGPPAAPTALDAVASNQAVVLQWEAPSGTPVADGYNVYRAEDTPSNTTGAPLNGSTPVEATGYTDDTIDAGTLYVYRVTAVSEGGEESSPTTAVEIRVFPAPPNRPSSP